MPEPPARPVVQPPPRPPGAARTPTFGPEPWRTDPDGEVWTHWDRWFCLVAVLDHHGDLDGLETVLVDKLRAPGFLVSTGDLEAKLSHLADLRARLAAADISVADVAADDEGVRARARKKVLDQALENRALTLPMRATPRARLRERALRGWWPRFPVSPVGCYEKFRRNVEVTGFVSERSTLGVVRMLSGRLDRLADRTTTTGAQIALHRAYQTALYELAERADDSCGTLGEERTAALLTYLDLDWRAGGVDADSYWRDLCDFLVLDDYALVYEVETDVFAHVGAADVDLVEAVLLGLADEYRAHHLDYTSGEALQLLAWLHVAGRHWDRYVETARRLGSRHWKPIVAMAESALRVRNHALAVDVFAAANRAGPQQDHLRRRCRELTGVDLSNQPHLRVVGGPG
jgi:hypothetical protein